MATFYTAYQIANLLGITGGRFSQLVKDGTILPGVRVGQRFFYSAEHVAQGRKWLSENGSSAHRPGRKRIHPRKHALKP